MQQTSKQSWWRRLLSRRPGQKRLAADTARVRVEAAASRDRQTVLRELARGFAVRQDEAIRRANRASRFAPILIVISAGGTAFAGAAVALNNLTAGWRTAIVIVTFVATGVGAAAAALRPNERAQAAKVDAANASALLTWLDILAMEHKSLSSAEFVRRVQALRAWDLHQLGSQPYTYSGDTPWTPPGTESGHGRQQQKAPTASSSSVRHPQASTS